MKHIIEARNGALQAALNATASGLAEKLCLVIDLQGRLRVLAKLGDQHDPAALSQRLDEELRQACEGYWSAEIWFDRDKTHPMGKASPAELALFARGWAEARPAPSGAGTVYVLDRRYSKEGWFDASASPPWPYVENKTPPIVSFYSFKGGVGRSTALASMAIQCSRAGKRVLIVDFDLEAPGLASVFPPPESSPVDVGVLDFLVEYPVVGTAFQASELVYVYDQKGVVGTGEIRVVAAGRVDSWYLEKLSRLDYHRLVSRPVPARAKPEDSPLHDLLDALRVPMQPDVILMDSRAGLHDLGGLALSSMAHWHVLFGLDSAQSWDGLRLAIAHLGRERVETGQPQRDCVMVQSMARPQEGRQESTERFRRRAYEVFCQDYYDDPANPDAEWPVPDELAADEPHYPAALVHDNRVMGYSNVETVADYLCQGDFQKLYATLMGKLGINI
jgi:hypothetical protein